MNKNGIHTEFHENGKKVVEGTFKDGESISAKWY
jgi:antitoxin component YwqK of YwqJK toxin-antitoxin module